MAKYTDTMSHDSAMDFMFNNDSEVERGHFKKLEKIIATSGPHSFDFAARFGGRFRLGEKAIAKIPILAVRYAIEVIKGRFTVAEKSIATDAEASYIYAKRVLNKRFVAGEAVIATSAEYSAMYAVEILKGPFPDGEAAIATAGDYSTTYAIHAIKSRFPLGEKAIQYSAFDALRYAVFFDIKDFIKPEMEEEIAHLEEYSILYAVFVLEKPFPAGEKTILDSYWERAYSYARFLVHGVSTPSEASFWLQFLDENMDMDSPAQTEKLEKIIATDAMESLTYAQRLGEAFKLGEPEIKKHPFVWKLYQRWLKTGY